ncbi:Ndc1 protein [Maudiozyma humilis]|uniref:Ndc1 protein n=1 Tax=Maudiozyma humilis TaxID=51915 RepID=A0AAV5RPK0_MAUHU|nr:Ndc1 protein [Kazachstania humilis]
MVDKSRASRSKYSYNTIFSDICKTRFNNMVVKFFLNTILLQAIFLTFISKRNSSFTQGIFLLFPKYLSLYSVAIGLIITRKNFLHIQSLGYSSTITQVLGQLCSFKAVAYTVTFTISSILISSAISDNFLLRAATVSNVQYYRVFTWILIPATYTVQHLVFDADKLVFGIDSEVQAPQEFIVTRIPKTLAKSAILSAMVHIVSPVLFFAIGWPMFLSFGGSIQFFLLSFFVFFQIEIINVAFNAHMSIGCLHKGKPISSLSPTPIETLLSGLASKRPFTKFTAFQELSYRATSGDISLRVPIYSAEYKSTNLWPGILRECTSVIETSNNSVSQYLKTLENTLSKNAKSHAGHRHRDANNDTGYLFGNTPSAVGNDGESAFYNTGMMNNNETSSFLGTQRLQLHEDDIMLNTARRNARNSHAQASEYVTPGEIDSSRIYNDMIVTREPKVVVMAKALLEKAKKYTWSLFFVPNARKPETQQLSLLELWSLSKDRQAEKLVPLAVCHMESVISLMGFLTRAIDESPRGSVVASVGEVLKHLERSVAILGRYSDWQPEGSKKSGAGEQASKPTDVVSLLYEISISAFLEIVLKYNDLLNTVYLDDDVVKLSKWVLDTVAQE